MASMIPEGVNQFTTDVEGRVYHFLQEAAKPDTVHTAWYTPDVEDREPDYAEARRMSLSET